MTGYLTQARLGELWTFDDAAASEQRFRDELASVPPGSMVAAELTTQLARALGLQGRFAEADDVLDAIGADGNGADGNGVDGNGVDGNDGGDGVVLARALLERGRLRNSSGHPDVAIPLFEEALVAAAAVGSDFLAVDAAHMLAIADPARSERWTARALETVEETTDPQVKRWAVSLHNNRGWALSEEGDLPGALAEMELAADAARDYGTPQQRVWAQEAIDEIRASISQP